MNTLLDQQIAAIFSAGHPTVDELIAPLTELAQDSSSLVVGYGVAQAGVRGDMIPYFHVCGTYTDVEPVRALVVGGWAGTESVTPKAIVRLLAAMESRLSLVSGLEVTGYPVANLDAYRENVFLTAAQQAEIVRCWENSPCGHIQVLENELRRYAYDVLILLRENPYGVETEVEAWLPEGESRAVVSDALERYGTAAPDLRWKINPLRPTYARSLTPVPDMENQPAEILIGLPGAHEPRRQADEALGLTLSLLHATRQARQEGIL